MTDPQRPITRAEYFEFAYHHMGEPWPPGMYERVIAANSAAVARATRQSSRVVPFRPFTPRQQNEYLQTNYGPTPPRGIGVNQGEYVTLSAEEVNEDRHFIATDYLMDCHALILVARDAQGRVQRTLLSHLDSATDIARAVPQMLARMPAGTQVEATLIGSPQGINPFIVDDTLQALLRAPSVSRIRHNLDVATTVAVDTTTGRILVSPVAETEASRSRIAVSDLPIAITFGDRQGNISGADIRNVAFQSLRQGRLVQSQTLIDGYSVARGFNGYMEFDHEINAMITSDGGLSAEELQRIARGFSEQLQQPIELVVTPPSQNETRSTIHVRNASGADLGTFVSPILPGLTTPRFAVRGD